VGPSGKRILLLSDAGGITDVGGINMTFDRGAAAQYAAMKYTNPGLAEKLYHALIAERSYGRHSRKENLPAKHAKNTKKRRKHGWPN
jgi:hypothetical protein